MPLLIPYYIKTGTQFSKQANVKTLVRICNLQRDKWGDWVIHNRTTWNIVTARRCLATDYLHL